MSIEGASKQTLHEIAATICMMRGHRLTPNLKRSVTMSFRGKAVYGTSGDIDVFEKIFQRWEKKNGIVVKRGVNQ